MKEKNRTYFCPICNVGTFEVPQKIQLEDIEIKKHIISILLKKGYGVRQIQRGLGYASPRSVSLIIKELNKK